MDRACPDIAHYNYTLRFRSCGLSRGAYGSALRTRQGLSALCNPTKEWPSLWKLRSVASTPENPEQEVTLSLHSPIKAMP
ncbi:MULTISPECIES: hypothetical protein [Bacteroidales]|uniref:hypothetical protein n=1 Tax=Bacteroidales TaxID=171549 RepID=UPI001899E046|nr:hypothetical protein [Bacteroides fragilis]MCS2351810.1 hypothetical protein [Bacteroides fragilis]MCS2671392.1 hypothetical protein [Bacteroides fragilis]